jgi:hypothetical protein
MDTMGRMRTLAQLQWQGGTGGETVAAGEQMVLGQVFDRTLNPT